MLSLLPAVAHTMPNHAQLHTCWPGAEDKQVLHSTFCSSHRSWHTEPEMMPLWYWSH